MSKNLHTAQQIPHHLKTVPVGLHIFNFWEEQGESLQMFMIGKRFKKKRKVNCYRGLKVWHESYALYKGEKVQIHTEMASQNVPYDSRDFNLKKQVWWFNKTNLVYVY